MRGQETEGDRFAGGMENENAPYADGAANALALGEGRTHGGLALLRHPRRRAGGQPHAQVLRWLRFLILVVLFSASILLFYPIGQASSTSMFSGGALESSGQPGLGIPRLSRLYGVLL